MNLPGRGITALFGASGSGKTTCLRCMAGLERWPGGVFSVNGQVWQDHRTWLPPHRRALGYVFQEPSLFAHLSVRANLEYGWRRVGAAQRRVDWDQALGLLGVEPLLQRMPSQLSGGEKQRVAMARALLTSPQLLLMDEPLAALDAPRKAEILPYLERLHSELAMPVVYVSHALDEVLRLADHLVLLDAGQVVASGALSEMLARLDLPVMQLDDAATVVQASVAEHDAVYGLTRIVFDGGSLWVGLSAQALGSTVRARVQARDVSLALSPPQRSSILNVLAGRIVEMRDEGPDKVLVLLALGQSEQRLASRITRRSRDHLGLYAGQAVHAQIKGVALM